MRRSVTIAGVVMVDASLLFYTRNLVEIQELSHRALCGSCGGFISLAKFENLILLMFVVGGAVTVVGVLLPPKARPSIASANP